MRFLAPVLVALATVPAGAAAGPGIEVLATHRFAIETRSDLFPDAGGAITLAVPRIVATEDNASLRWLTHGLEAKPHPVLGGRYRSRLYEDLLDELLVWTTGPPDESVLAAAERLLEGIDIETPIDSVRATFTERASALAPSAAKEIAEATELLARFDGSARIGHAVTNGTLEVLVLDALHEAQVRSRVNAVGELVRASALDADGAFNRALGSATTGISRRRQLRRQVIKHKIQFSRNDGSNEVLGSTTVGLLPASLARAALSRFPEEAIENIAIDHGVKVGSPGTIRDFLATESALVLLATLEHALFADTPFDPTCEGPDAARGFRIYVAHTYRATLERFLEVFSDEFFDRRLGWSATGGAAHLRLVEENAAHRRFLAEHLAACAAPIVRDGS